MNITFGMRPHWADGYSGGTIYPPSLSLPQSMPDFKGSGSTNSLSAVMGRSVPGFNANTQLTSSPVFAEGACYLDSSTETPTPDERMFRVSNLTVNAYYEEDSSLPPPPPRETYTREQSIDLVASGTFSIITTTTTESEGDASLLWGFSPWAVSGVRQEKPPHTWSVVYDEDPENIYTLTYHCEDGELVYSEEIGVGWVAGKVDAILATKSATISSAFNLGNSLGSGSLSSQTESQSRNGRYTIGKVASYTYAYSAESNSEAWNGNYYHIRGWEKRSLLPVLYTNPSLSPTGIKGIDLYHENVTLSTLTEEITSRRVDEQGTWDVADDYLAAIPYRVGLLTGLPMGIEDALVDYRFFSVSGARYRIYICLNDQSGFVEVPAIGLSDPWPGLGGAWSYGYHEVYKVEEWSEALMSWVVIGVGSGSYWYDHPGELEAIQDAWEEAGVSNQYTSNFVSGELASGVKVIAFGRARAGYQYGHPGFTDPGTYFKTKTDTSSRTSRVVGVSGIVEGILVSSYSDSGNLLPPIYMAEGSMDGRVWLDETSGSQVAGGVDYPYVEETNTYISAISHSDPIDLGEDAVVRFDGTGGDYGILGRVLETMEDTVEAATIVDPPGSSVPRVMSAITAPPMIAGAGESVEISYVRVARQP
jgi:hypothetical protein